MPSAFDAICRRGQSGRGIMAGVARDKLSWREKEVPQRCPAPYSSDIFVVILIRGGAHSTLLGVVSGSREEYNIY
jgi:hypothetical protein